MKPEEYNPLLMAFDGAPQIESNLKFQQWLRQRQPEDHTVTPEAQQDWQQFLRREKLKEIMKSK